MEMETYGACPDKTPADDTSEPLLPAEISDSGSILRKQWRCPQHSFVAFNLGVFFNSFLFEQTNIHDYCCHRVSGETYDVSWIKIFA
jgi:hypothetical protein